MAFTPPLVTAFTAGLLLIMQTALLLNVVATRRRVRQSLGDGGHEELTRAVRRHGNLAENAAIFIAGFALLEMIGGTRSGLVTLCATFIAGRIAHAIGLSMKKTFNPVRVAGVALTVLVGVALGCRLMVRAMTHLIG